MRYMGSVTDKSWYGDTPYLTPVEKRNLGHCDYYEPPIIRTGTEKAVSLGLVNTNNKIYKDEIPMGTIDNIKALRKGLYKSES